MLVLAVGLAGYTHRRRERRNAAAAAERHAMKNAFDLTGPTILVTGAARGIGAATARDLRVARRGADPGRSRRRATMSRSESAAQAATARAFTADVSRRADMERIAGEVGPVDALVLNAALCPWDEDWLAPDWDESFERVMAVNVLGPIHCARAFLPGMIERRSGRIVLVGSLAGPHGRADRRPALCRLEGRRACACEMAGAAGGAARRAGQRRRAGLGRDADDGATSPSTSSASRSAARRGRRRSPGRSPFSARPPQAISAAPCST